MGMGGLTPQCMPCRAVGGGLVVGIDVAAGEAGMDCA